MFARLYSHGALRYHNLRCSAPTVNGITRKLSSILTEQRIDDEFVFPVHTSADTENSFCWSGAIIHDEVCNLNSDEFIAEKKSVLLRGKNVVILKAEHKGLGMVTFAAIKGEAIPDWRFCSIAIHGDPIDTERSERYFDEIKETISGFVSCLFGIGFGGDRSDSEKCAVLRTAHSKYLTPEYLIGNFPHDTGHFKMPGNYYRSESPAMNPLLDCAAEDDQLVGHPVVPLNAADMNVGAVVRDHSHLMSVLNPANTVAAARRQASLLSTEYVLYSDLVNTSATVTAASMTPVLIAETSAWVTVDLNLETPVSFQQLNPHINTEKSHAGTDGSSGEDMNSGKGQQSDVIRTIRTKVPTATSTKMLLQLISHWENSEFNWKICNIMCLDE